MKIETTAGALAKALKVLKRCAPKASSVTIPVLSMAKFDAGRISVTDLDKEMSVNLPHSGFDGEGLAPYWPLMRLADAFSEDAVLDIISRDGGGLTVSSGSSRYVLPNLPADAWPAMTPATDMKRIVSDGARLRDALSYSLFCISREETRYYLNGACLMGRAVVGTDGHRLALTEDVLDQDVQNVIVPHEAVRIILDMPGDIGFSISPAEHPRHFIAETAGVRLVSKLIDGTFPDVRRVIPAETNVRSKFNAREMAAALKRLDAIGMSGFMSMGINFDGQACRVACLGLDNQSGFEVIHGEGDPISIGFNLKYLRQMLANADSDDLVIDHEGGLVEGSPVTIRDSERKRLMLLMPLRLDNDVKALAQAGDTADAEGQKAA